MRRRCWQTASDVPARLTAPAAGLFLERVYYEGDRAAIAAGQRPSDPHHCRRRPAYSLLRYGATRPARVGR